MQRVRAELGAIVKADAATWQPAAALRDLATIDAFQLFLTTGLDPLLDIALRTARGVEPAVAAFTADAKEKDLSRRVARGPGDDVSPVRHGGSPGHQLRRDRGGHPRRTARVQTVQPQLASAHGRAHDESSPAVGLSLSRLARAHVPAHGARQAARRPA